MDPPIVPSTKFDVDVDLGFAIFFFFLLCCFLLVTIVRCALLVRDPYSAVTVATYHEENSADWWRLWGQTLGTGVPNAILYWDQNIPVTPNIWNTWKLSVHVVVMFKESLFSKCFKMFQEYRNQDAGKLQLGKRYGFQKLLDAGFHFEIMIKIFKSFSLNLDFFLFMVFNYIIITDVLVGKR